MRRGDGFADELLGLAEEMRHWASQVDPAFFNVSVGGEWSVTENLAHAIEFIRYWADQVDGVVANPGMPFGRTHDDAERSAWVANHADDDRSEILAALDEAARYGAERLRSIAAADWTATGVHANRGVMTLLAIVQFFLIDHLRDHLEQARRAYAAVSS